MVLLWIILVYIVPLVTCGMRMTRLKKIKRASCRNCVHRLLALYMLGGYVRVGLDGY